jgi:hypothetical protein
MCGGTRAALACHRVARRPPAAVPSRETRMEPLCVAPPPLGRTRSRRRVASCGVDASRRLVGTAAASQSFGVPDLALSSDRPHGVVVPPPHRVLASRHPEGPLHRMPPPPPPPPLMGGTIASLTEARRRCVRVSVPARPSAHPRLAITIVTRTAARLPCVLVGAEGVEGLLSVPPRRAPQLQAHRTRA